MSTNNNIVDEPVKLHHHKLVNNQTFHDLIFMVEKQQIFAHNAVLAYRCNNLINNKNKNKMTIKKGKKGASTIEITNYTFKTLLEVMNYCYTGVVDFTKLSVPQILALNAAAIELGLDRLQWLAENHLRTTLAMDNIFIVLKGAHALNQQGVKEFCYHFVLKNYNDFLANKDAIKDLGVDLFHSVVEIYQQSQTGEVKPLVVPPEPTNTLVSDFKKIWDEMAGSDITFKVGNEYLLGHRAIIGGPTNELTNLCSQTPVQTKARDHPEAVVVPNVKGKEVTVSTEAFRSFCKFVYYGDTQITPLAACELVPFAKDYGLVDLQRICENIIRKNINKDTALPILAVTYLPQMETSEAVSRELRENSISFILANLPGVDLQPLRKMNPNMAIDILIARQSPLKRSDSTASTTSHSAPNSPTIQIDAAPAEAPASNDTSLHTTESKSSDAEAPKVETSLKTSDNKPLSKSPSKESVSSVSTTGEDKTPHKTESTSSGKREKKEKKEKKEKSAKKEKKDKKSKDETPKSPTAAPADKEVEKSPSITTL